MACYYQGKAYSDGSLICVGGRELRCVSGSWKETGYLCSAAGRIPLVTADHQAAFEEVAKDIVLQNDRYVTAVLAALNTMAQIYLTVKQAEGKTGGLIGNISELSAKLAAISSQIAQLEKALGEIFSYVKKLPEEIAGKISEGNSQVALSLAAGMAGRIADRTRKPEFLKQYRVELREDLDALDNQLGVVKDLQGVAGLVAITPLMGVWLSGAIALEKARLKWDDGHVADPPWERVRMIETEAKFKELFESVEELDERYSKIARPRFPSSRVEQNVVLIEGYRYFQVAPPGPPNEGPVPAPSPGNPKVPDDPTNPPAPKFRILDAETESPTLQVLRFMHAPPPFPGKPPQPSYWYWDTMHIPPKPFDYPDPKPIEAFKQFIKDREESAQFYRALPKALEQKPIILESFVPIPGIFDPEKI